MNDFNNLTQIKQHLSTGGDLYYCDLQVSQVDYDRSNNDVVLVYLTGQRNTSQFLLSSLTKLPK